jgi:hypothetical protein
MIEHVLAGAADQHWQNLELPAPGAFVDKAAYFCLNTMQKKNRFLFAVPLFPLRRSNSHCP